MTSEISYYEKSSWCCICKGIERCFSKQIPIVDTRVNNVAVRVAIGSPPNTPILTSVSPAHTRTRTWQISGGRMTYALEEHEEKKLR